MIVQTEQVSRRASLRKCRNFDGHRRDEATSLRIALQIYTTQVESDGAICEFRCRES